MKLWLTPLRCPQCGQAIPHRSGDLLMTCLSCFGLFEVRQGTPTSVPFRVPVSFSQESPDLSQKLAWLPYWCFHLEPQVKGPDPRQVAKAQEVLKDWKRIYVSGTVHLGQPDPYRFDLDFTRRKLGTCSLKAPELAGPILRGLFPCPRSAQDAARFLVPYLICLLDPVIDVTRLDLSSQVSNLELVAVPFLRIESGLHEPNSGHVLSQRFLVSPESQES